MRVFVEGLERNRIMIFSRGFPRIMKRDQASERKGLICNRMSVVVLPVS